MDVQVTDLSSAVLDVAGTAICVVDSKGTVVLWNRAASALTGISLEQIEGRDFKESLLLPGDIDTWKRELDRITSGKVDPPRHFQTRWRINGGSPLPLTCRVSVIPEPPGEIQYIVCTVIDSVSRDALADRINDLRDISSLLHDTISQDLVALSFNVEEIEITGDVPRSKTQAEATQELIDRCCRDIRAISSILTPPPLSDATIEESIELYAGCVREETGLTIAVDIDPVSETVPPEGRLLFLAAVQSWVIRGVRCGTKPKLSIRLGNRGSATVLELEMISAGALHPPSLPQRGWSVIRDITRSLGGKFDITGDSFRVCATILLPG